ncbi:hypothetical protein N658DRAFT_495313 [Parathielavia hyrcaniae]|uniref:Uncharacterized protein n=1 Tax=Parathielavia hyrcaniae TaxID=113614 RepID=A0AAN6T3E9_9PEZI|nr:hypothetical protein N658DRAFT_495313 [Parathielavia hyrcaniae]
MNREIPGFYYDSVKRKYFRIEDNRTAPAEAAWSAQNVKRRAVQQKDKTRRQDREKRAAGRVKRARVRGVPLLGGLLAREIGEVGAGAVPAAGEEVVRAWAGGLKEKGSVKPWPWVDNGTITGLWVGGSGEHTGPGVLFASGVQDRMAASLVPRDADDSINLRGHEHAMFQRSFYTEDVVAIKFHDPSSSLLVACEQGGSIGIKRYAPQPPHTDIPSPAFLVDSAAHFTLFDSTLGASTASTIHALQPAAHGSSLTCIAGTDQGIIKLQDNKLDWFTPRPRPSQRHKQGRPDPTQPPWQGDILSVDFAHHNPTEVILAGTRSSHVCLLDMRVPVREWTTRSNAFRHVSSIAHVRSVGPHEVLAAGPRNAMAIYDIRFLQQAPPPPPPPPPPLPPSPWQTHKTKQDHHHHHRQTWHGNATRPIVEFPSYRNAAHIHTGLDVLAEPGYGSRGIVAAAHDDATVGLYSLRDGARIPGGAVDSIGAAAGTVVRSIMWATLPGDRHPGLFVGEGPCVKKYSFWA